MRWWSLRHLKDFGELLKQILCLWCSSFGSFFGWLFDTSAGNSCICNNIPWPSCNNSRESCLGEDKCTSEVDNPCNVYFFSPIANDMVDVWKFQVMGPKVCSHVIPMTTSTLFNSIKKKSEHISEPVSCTRKSGQMPKHSICYPLATMTLMSCLHLIGKLSLHANEMLKNCENYPNPLKLLLSACEFFQ